MTIGKRLYTNFGAILAMVVVLFAVNMIAVQREHAAKTAAAQSLAMAEATDVVRFQMMQNRLFLSNYLLSGDTREMDKMYDGIGKLQELISDAKTKANSDQQRFALAKVQQYERAWANDFAQPLVNKRKDVDGGNATVAELQIFYLQKDAGSWIKNSSGALDVADTENRKVVEERRKSDETAAAATSAVAITGTLLALLLGIAIAYRTAKSITDPLNDLMSVASQIADAGELDHKIDIQRDDEIGALARTFNKMVTYLKEMAGVSQAIAGGDLTVKVTPRSRHDTLGNAFASMVDGLRTLVRSVRDGSSQVASGSNQVASASDESAKISLQASSAIDEVTSTMHEM
ncbi:MAG: HAMP domain-containing protein, partial [Chlamydiota bacterium]